MSNNLKLFSFFKESNSLPEIITAKGVIKPTGLGSILLRLKTTNSKSVSITLVNVHYVPGLSTNLFSGTVIREKAYICRKTDTVCMKQDNHEIAALKVIGKSLFLNQDQDYQDLDSLPPSATIATAKLSMKL